MGAPWIPNTLIRQDLALIDPDRVARVELRGDPIGRRWRDDGIQVVEDPALVRALATAFKACVMEASHPYDPSLRTLETIAFIDRRPPHTAYQVWFRMEALLLFSGARSNVCSCLSTPARAGVAGTALLPARPRIDKTSRPPVDETPAGGKRVDAP